MVTPKPLESRWQALLDTSSAPATPRLPAVVPTERRNLAARYALLRRIYREFKEMPCISVTPNQAARLFGLPPDVAVRILQRLADKRVLRVRRDGQFFLGSEEL